MRCLEKEPPRRFASAAALGEAIGARDLAAGAEEVLRSRVGAVVARDSAAITCLIEDARGRSRRASSPAPSTPPPPATRLGLLPQPGPRAIPAPSMVRARASVLRPAVVLGSAVLLVVGLVALMVMERASAPRVATMPPEAAMPIEPAGRPAVIEKALPSPAVAATSPLDAVPSRPAIERSSEPARRIAPMPVPAGVPPPLLVLPPSPAQPPIPPVTVPSAAAEPAVNPKRASAEKEKTPGGKPRTTAAATQRSAAKDTASGSQKPEGSGWKIND
jgi:hypothetical protein